MSVAATTVEVSMLPANAQPFYATDKGLDILSSSKSSPLIPRRRAHIREIVTGIALLGCIFALCLLYAKVLAIEQRPSCPVTNSQQENGDSVADSAVFATVVTDATTLQSSGNEPGITTQQNTISSRSPYIPDNLSSDRPKSLVRRIRQIGTNGGGGHVVGAGGAGGRSIGTGWNTLPSSHLAAHQSHNAHPFIHVTGITDPVLTRGDWFTWHSEAEGVYHNIATTQLQFVRNKFVQITQPGYYFVYSQVTYSDVDDYAIGHEIVRKPNCGNGDNQRLLHSIKSQVPTVTYQSGELFYPEDSGYTGGLFYLQARDRIGVRPLSGHGVQTRRFVADQPSGSYFGLFLLSPDNQAADLNACHGFN